MAAINRNPKNRDLLQSTKFKLNFARLPGVTFFCQTINLPGLSMTEAMFPTPFIDLYAPGDKAIYDMLNVTFLVDEDLVAWEQMHDWLRAMLFPTDFSEYVNLKRLSNTSAFRKSVKLPPQYSDATLSIYTNKNNVNLRIDFKDVFPTTLSSIQFSSMDSAETIITADATFRFSYYNIVRV
jgi:hypothetical protein